MAATAEASPPFGTVLVARSPQDSPSRKFSLFSLVFLALLFFTIITHLIHSISLVGLALELQMRACSARLRVVQKLTGGAHMLLPGSDATIAIRAYFPNTLVSNDDDDSLVAFRNAFMYPICFFVLPPGMPQQEQLGDARSFLTKAQLIMSNKDDTPTGHQKVCFTVLEKF